MKNLKKVFVLLLFFMFIISIFGTINSLAAEPTFKLINASILDKSDTVDAKIINFDNDDVNINSTFHKVDDFVSYKLVIKNTSTKNYKIKAISSNNPNPYLDYSYNDLTNQIINAGDSFELNIKAVYKNEVTDLSKRDSEESYKVTFEFTDEKGNEIDEDIIINPKTNDNIIIFIVLGGISLAGLIILLVKNKKGIKVIIAALLLIPLTIYAYSSKVSFNFDTNTKLRDKLVVKEIINGEEVIKVVPYNSTPEKPEDPNIPGYVFEEWTVNGKPYDFSQPLKDDETVKAKLKAITYNITYDLDGGVASGNKSTYTVETDSFTLNNPTKKGYNFAGWTGSNGESLQTKVTINKGSTGNKNYIAHFSKRTDVDYKVIHRYELLNGDYDVEEENLKGVYDTKVTPETKVRTGYKNTTPVEITLTVDPEASVTYTYELEEYQLSYNNENIDLTNSTEPGLYKYGTLITLKALNKEGHTFSKWSNNNQNQTYTFNISSNVIDIEPIYTINEYTVTLNPNNGSEKSTFKRNYNTAVGTLPNVNKDNYIFKGWYYGNELVTSDRPITDDIEFTAMYGKSAALIEVENDNLEIINKSGTSIIITNASEIDEEYSFSSLNSSIASVSNDGVVTANSIGSTKIRITGNDTGLYKEINVTVTPRTFKVEFDENGGEEVDDVNVTEGNKLSSLPTTTRTNYIFDNWYTDNNFNVIVTTDTNIDSNKEFIANWKKSVYFLNITNPEISITNQSSEDIVITNANEIGEEFTYSSLDTSIASVNSNGLVTANGVGTTKIIITGTTSNLTKEVNVTVTPRKFTVSYNSNGGSAVASSDVDEGTTINPLPETTYPTYIFDNWYLDNGNFDTLASSVMPISQNRNFIAKWKKSVYFLNITNPEISITNQSSEDIVITNASEIGEEFTYSSLDTSIASVNSNGLVTANGVGTTKIIITGKTSNLTKEVNVTVTPRKFTVSYNSNGGSAVASSDVDEGTTINPLPETTYPTYIFDNWYLDNGNFDTLASSVMPINQNRNFIAKWKKSVYYAEIENENISLDISETSFVNITNSSEIGESYEFTSLDENIVTVDSQTGELTPVGVGSTTVRITGNTSSLYQTISVAVTQSETPIICKKATSLHTETCQRNDSKGCNSSYVGYSYGQTITYGNIISSDIYLPGDALDCNVDGTGYNQRFYYLTTTDNKLVLISNTNYEGADKQKIENIFHYSDGLSKLPDTTSDQWNNLPITFNFDNNIIRSARYPYYSEIEAACNEGNEITNNTKGVLKTCKFLFENSRFISETNGRTGVWITQKTPGSSLYYRYHTTEFSINEKDSSSQNAVRPVIEVPTNQIENSYVIKFDAGDGTFVNGSEYKSVAKGEKIGVLPEVSKTNHQFDSWYTSDQYVTSIDENTVPNDYVTYYAKYLINIDNVELSQDSFDFQVGAQESIVISSEEDIEPYTFASSDENVAIVSNNGLITAVGEGDATITISGTLSLTTKTVTVHVTPETDDYIITFDSQGAGDVDELHVEKNTAVSNLPEPTLTDNVFIGWFTSTNYDVEVKNGDIITNDMILYARWMPTNSVCEMNKTYYSSIQTALDTAPTTKTTIKLVKNVTLTSTLDLNSKNNDKNIVLDLNNYSLTYNNNNVIKNKATLEIKNGTINCNAGSGAIDVESGGKLIMNSGSIIATNNRQAIYNNGGTVEIGGTAFLSAKAAVDSTNRRGTVQNQSGTMIITGGTIISTSAYAVTLVNGSLTIGVKDGVASQTTPLIIGKTYGVSANSDKTFSFYDGVIKGVSGAVEDIINKLPDSNIEEGYIKDTSTTDTYDFGGTIGEKVVQVLYLVKQSTDYKIQFNVDGGTIDQAFISVQQGNSVSYDDLPVPSKGVYHFDGWYDEFDNPISYPFTPESDTVFYAKWSYNSSDEVVNFNMDNDPMTVYYNSISTWKDQISVQVVDNKEVIDSTEFEASMLSNFNNYSCSSCTGPKYQECPTPAANATLCDQPKGYDTGVNDELNVYLSNETTPLSYITVENGIIYNMIPGQTYRWELASDSNVYGYVKALGTRRNIYSSVRNVRDLGGLSASYTDENGTTSGTLKYGILFRGAKLNTSSDATSLAKVGINEELDLRSSSDNKDPHVGTYKNSEIINYVFDTKTSTSRAEFRDALTLAMEDVVAGNSIYFHCKIGTDRTGTLAYFLEGLLGVPYEQRVQDYELSYFYGLLNRHRYHDYLDGSSYNPRFTTMAKTYDTNDKIYNWYIDGLSGQDLDDAKLLVKNFRLAMIKKTN